MSDFDSLREDFARAFAAIGSAAETNARFAESVNRENDAQWNALNLLRDDLIALANRVESLTRAVMAEPHDVADAVIRHEFTEDDAA